MKALLDTHAFLWWILADQRVSPRAHDFIHDSENTLFLSAASAWEIIIKAQTGRMKLPQEPAAFITRHLSLNDVEALPVQLSHALHLATLPVHHRDPFDRILIAQAQVEKLPILTSDPLIARYGVEIIW